MFDTNRLRLAEDAHADAHAPVIIRTEPEYRQVHDRRFYAPDDARLIDYTKVAEKARLIGCEFDVRQDGAGRTVITWFSAYREDEIDAARVNRGF